MGLGIALVAARQAKISQVTVMDTNQTQLDKGIKFCGK
jgi:3-hydroxyacyl-CoA dehydrogenase